MKKTLYILLFLIVSFITIRIIFDGNYYQGDISDHFDGKIFFNPGYPKDKGFLDFLKWQMTEEKGPWPDKVAVIKYDIPPQKVEGSKLRVSYIGHSTLLLQTEGLNIITDPLFSERTSPVSFAGPKRVINPGVKFKDLPKIDIMLVSHNHYDHMDLKTIERIWQRDKPRIIVPLGNDVIIKNYNKNIKAEAYDWEDEVNINDDIIIALEPMYHWSKRTFFDTDEALWAAFVIKTPNGNIYIACDTGYGDGTFFKETIKKYDSFRFTAIPIGAYEPRWFMKYGHANPEEAVLIHKILGSPRTIGIHFGVIPLTDVGYEEPVKKLEEAKDKHGIDEKFIAPFVGQFWYFE